MAGTVKAFNLPIEYVLYEMSYVNTIMYGAVLPSYRARKDKKDKRGKDGRKQKVIKADDRKNKDAVRKFLANIKE